MPLSITDQRTLIDDLSKRELLNVLECVPQRFWPPAPTRQDKATILRAIRDAVNVRAYEYEPQHARKEI